MADVETALGILADWRQTVVDPALKDQGGRIEVLESYRDKMDGKITIIVWLNGVVILLLISMILSLFTWGLSHITLKVMNDSPVSSSAPADASSGVSAYRAQRSSQ